MSVTELRSRNQAQQIFNRGLTSNWRNFQQIYDPSIWLTRYPEMEEQMKRDADISQALNYRQHLIAGRQWNLQPLDDAAPGAEMAVELGTKLLEPIEGFTASRHLLSSAFFSGDRFARIHSVPRKLRLGDGKLRTWVVPTRLEDLDKRSYRIVRDQPSDPEIITAHWEKWDVAKGEWDPESPDDAWQTIHHTYQNDQASMGYGRGLREALAWWWYTKSHVWDEIVQAIEKFGQGMIVIKRDGTRAAEEDRTNAQIDSDYIDTIEDMRGRHILLMDKDDEFEVVSGNADGWQLMDAMETKLKNTITTLILGSNLPTTGNDSGSGSYALAKVQENSTEALINFDRENLEERLTKDLLGCVWRKNIVNMRELGLAEDKPRFIITQDTKQDPMERAEVFTKAHNMGLPVSLEDAYEQMGIKQPEPGEEILEGATEPVGGGFGMGQPGLGNPEPFGAGVP